MQNGVLLAFIVLYLLGTLAIGWWAARRVKTTADFVVAGKNLPMFIAACALFATWFGSETIMGASSEFISRGLLGVIEDPMGAALCLFLSGLLVARPLYKRNLYTFSDFFRLRYNRQTEIVSAIFMVPSYFSWIAAQLVALAIILQVVSGLEKVYGVLICTLLVLGYTYVGGMWSVTITEFVQTILIIVGLLFLAFKLFLQVGGLEPMQAAAPEDFFRFWPEAEPIPILHWIAAWMTIGLGSIPQQDVFQRVMSARSERASVNACYTSSFMYLTVAALPLLIAYCGRMLYPELAEGDEAQMMIPHLVLEHTGLWTQILFFGALLSAILSTCSGAMLAPATVIGENLIKPLYNDLSDKQLLRIMRLSVVAVAGVTSVMAMMRNNIYELVGESSALSLVSLFTPLLAGLYWKRSTAAGAMASMVAGIVVWVITLQLCSDHEEVATGMGSFWEQMAQVPPMLYGFAASIIAMVVVSLLTSHQPQENQWHYPEQVKEAP
ncbi:MAG: sodium:solute symporter family protein [Saprospiraceae bacterium]|nr:sodium:solute symporter family protein [Saprospiraceae bacterium]MDW8483279.1 sodium:solute symporter family protein [Saprospiraceae bacterium]